MTETTELESPAYLRMQELITELLKSERTALTARQIRSILGTDDFLGDALEILTFIGLIKVEGSVLLPKYKYNHLDELQVNMKTCDKCGDEKPLLDFYQEWSGRPSAACKTCKIAAQKKRGRRTAKP